MQFNSNNSELQDGVVVVPLIHNLKGREGPNHKELAGAWVRFVLSGDRCISNVGLKTYRSTEAKLEQTRKVHAKQKQKQRKQVCRD